MLKGLVALLALALSAAGLGAADHIASAGSTAALAAMVAVLAAAVALCVRPSVAGSVCGTSSPVHPRRAIERSSAVSQSDPDAPGHPRPRAPQCAASAAN